MSASDKQSNSKMPLAGVAYACLSALLFGLTTPIAKLLLATSSPFMLAGLLYAGSGTGLLIWQLVTKKSAGQEAAKFSLPDFRWLTLVILFGGIVAPVLLFCGLSTVQASSASLFLNLEGVFTALLAWIVFREPFDRRLLAGMAAIVLAGLLLSVNFDASLTVSTGVFAIVGACFCWALDNNFTARIVSLDARHIALAKGLVAGAVNVSLALYLGGVLPAMPQLLSTLLVGFLGYGMSLTLFIVALRAIGTARTSAYFAAAPFIGAIVSIVLFSESVTVQFLSACALMAIGLWLHVSENHSHEHWHEELEHEHEHVHDEHHLHEHDCENFAGAGSGSNSGLGVASEAGSIHGANLAPNFSHSHSHKHERLMHSHAHFPDQHHGHSHKH